MMGALVEQGGEVYRLDSELHGITGPQNLVTVTGDRGARVRQVSVSMYSSQGSAEIPAGSYIIFLNQPYRQNVLALFEPQLYPDRMTATGEAERPYDVAGRTRYVFDTLNAPYQTLRDPAINETNLRSKYDAIVLPSDRSREPADSGAPAAEGGAGISDKGFVNLARFVEDGGTLICFDGSCGSLIRRWKLPLPSLLDGLRSSDFFFPGAILLIDVYTS